MRSEIFREELGLLTPELRALVSDFLNGVVPDYFWEIPATSTGKFHSKFDLGEGGLVKHTKMVVAIAQEMQRLETYADVNMNVVTAAAIIHDTFKNGERGAHYHTDHPQLAAEIFKRFAAEQSYGDMAAIQRVYNCVYLHMGQWSTKKALAERPNAVNGQSDAEIELVHLSDYIASRKFFDKALDWGTGRV